MKSIKKNQSLSSVITFVMLASCTGYIEGPGPDRLPPNSEPAELSTPRPGPDPGPGPGPAPTTTPSTPINDNDADKDSETATAGDANGVQQTPQTGNAAFSAILSKATFEQMFPGRSQFYTYEGLVEATNSYSAFANTGDDTARKREVAAFLANAAHETGGLVHVEEIAKGEYCSPTPSCPCANGKSYFGRGPIQLSWNYNYCAAGAALGIPLAEDPDLVARDPKVAWQTTLWFWMTQSGAGSMTAHNAIKDQGFGATIQTINGARECNGGNWEQVASRKSFYTEFARLLGVEPGDNLEC